MKHMFNIGNYWDEVLKEEFSSPYFKSISEGLENEYRDFRVYPPRDQVFQALKITDYNSVKVCVLGQDPYHGEGQANGMAFAVGKGVPFPPSLNNIFTELKNDLCVSVPKKNSACGTLNGWARQGVLLLNSSLTVRESQPQSHAFLGWERFTDAVICALSARQKPVVFILWGNSAIAKAKLIAGHHHIISSAHPSPLSASRGFFGSKPFSKANAFLVKNGITPVDWSDAEGVRASYYGHAGKIIKI